MGYVYRPLTRAFYNDEFEADYRKAGTWPGFYVRVSDEDYHKLMDGQSQGKVIVTGERCYPVLADPVIDWNAEAEAKRAILLAEAATETADWRIELQLDVISDEDKDLLIDWMAYTKLLKALQLESVADEEGFKGITWPAVPA